MSVLLENARATTVRIRATDAPFEAKDDLKARGYRWHAGDAVRRKAWWIDVLEVDLTGELEWLGEVVFPRRDLGDRPLPMESITAMTRYRS